MRLPFGETGSLAQILGIGKDLSRFTWPCSRLGLVHGLPRASVLLIAITVFLFAINVFSGLHEIWFQWPPRCCS
jgi:hypothetical protein